MCFLWCVCVCDQYSTKTQEQRSNITIPYYCSLLRFGLLLTTLHIIGLLTKLQFLLRPLKLKNPNFICKIVIFYVSSLKTACWLINSVVSTANSIL